jgi:hypothetical protein
MRYDLGGWRGARARAERMGTGLQAEGGWGLSLLRAVDYTVFPQVRHVRRARAYGILSQDSTNARLR